MRWLRAAAAGGCVAAVNLLAWDYLNGKVPARTLKAVAHESGNLSNLPAATLDSASDLESLSLQQALKWFEVAAQQGDSFSAFQALQLRLSDRFEVHSEAANRARIWLWFQKAVSYCSRLHHKRHVSTP